MMMVCRPAILETLPGVQEPAALSLRMRIMFQNLGPQQTAYAAENKLSWESICIAACMMIMDKPGMSDGGCEMFSNKL